MASLDDPHVVRPEKIIRFRGSQYSTINELIEEIKANIPPEEQYRTQCEALGVITKIKESVDDGLDNSSTTYKALSPA